MAVSKKLWEAQKHSGSFKKVLGGSETLWELEKALGGSETLGEFERGFWRWRKVLEDSKRLWDAQKRSGSFNNALGG